MNRLCSINQLLNFKKREQAYFSLECTPDGKMLKTELDKIMTEYLGEKVIYTLESRDKNELSYLTSKGENITVTFLEQNGEYYYVITSEYDIKYASQTVQIVKQQQYSYFMITGNLYTFIEKKILTIGSIEFKTDYPSHTIGNKLLFTEHITVEEFTITIFYTIPLMEDYGALPSDTIYQNMIDELMPILVIQGAESYLPVLIQKLSNQLREGEMVKMDICCRVAYLNKYETLVKEVERKIKNDQIKIFIQSDDYDTFE